MMLYFTFIINLLHMKIIQYNYYYNIYSNKNYFLEGEILIWLYTLSSSISYFFLPLMHTTCLLEACL
jgi:hypothetical protein